MSMILFVDGEEMILNGLKRIFFRKKEVIIKTATNDLDALTMLDQFQPDLVISDMRMPIRDGAEFHDKVKEKKCLIYTRNIKWLLTMGCLFC